MKTPITRESLPQLRQDIVFEANLKDSALLFHTTWGLFSPREVDSGTVLLLEHIETGRNTGQKAGQACRILDLGCGYGALGLPLAASNPDGHVTMVDKDFVAIEYCKKNAKLNTLANVEILLSNGLNHVPDGDFDIVVTNLPAKSGKELYYLMFYDVHSRLKPGGRFYIVTITGLRGFVKRTFNEIFGNYTKLKQGPVYTVAMAEYLE